MSPQEMGEILQLAHGREFHRHTGTQFFVPWQVREAETLAWGHLGAVVLEALREAVRCSTDTHHGAVDGVAVIRRAAAGPDHA